MLLSTSDISIFIVDIFYIVFYLSENKYLTIDYLAMNPNWWVSIRPMP